MIDFSPLISIIRVDPTGEFSKKWIGSKSIEFASAEVSLQKEMAHVRKLTNKKLDKFLVATDSQIGLEMLHLFVLDILGRDTPAAKIFLAKSLVE